MKGKFLGLRMQTADLREHDPLPLKSLRRRIMRNQEAHLVKTRILRAI